MPPSEELKAANYIQFKYYPPMTMPTKKIPAAASQNANGVANEFAAPVTGGGAGNAPST